MELAGAYEIACCIGHVRRKPVNVPGTCLSFTIGFVNCEVFLARFTHLGEQLPTKLYPDCLWPSRCFTTQRVAKWGLRSPVNEMRSVKFNMSLLTVCLACKVSIGRALLVPTSAKLEIFGWPWHICSLVVVLVEALMGKKSSFLLVQL
jgi:hypothetical protein